MDFGLLGENDRRGAGVERRVELAENRADAHVAVLQVGRGVALQREHAVPGEHIVGEAVLREFGEFHRADADDASAISAASSPCRSGFFSAMTAAARSTASSSTSVKLHVVAGAGLHQLAVLAEDRAEGDVLEIAGLAPAGGGGEDLAEMELLRHADDIPDLVGLPFVDAELGSWRGRWWHRGIRRRPCG